MKTINFMFNITDIRIIIYREFDCILTMIFHLKMDFFRSLFLLNCRLNNLYWHLLPILDAKVVCLKSFFFETIEDMFEFVLCNSGVNKNSWHYDTMIKIWIHCKKHENKKNPQKYSFHRILHSDKFIPKMHIEI